MPIELKKFKTLQSNEFRHSKGNKMISDGTIHRWARKEFPYPLILEIGSGPGGILREEHTEIIALDPLMHKFINRQWKICVAGTGEYLPFKDNCFDYIYCCDVIDHALDEYKIINEIYRVLNYGGKLYLYTDCKGRGKTYHHVIQCKEMLDILKNKFSSCNIKYDKSPVRHNMALYGEAIK